MSTTTYVVRDSATMLRRQLRHLTRYPGLTLTLIIMPVVLLLLFGFVFGETLGSGLGSSSAAPGNGGPAEAEGGGRAAYLTYVLPGVLLMTAASAAQGTAISVAMDMTGGIIARFRTMAIARSSVLTGHVLGSLAQALLGLLVILGLAIALGFRPDATPIEWLATAGILVLAALAMIWLSAALGLVTKSVESASNLPMPLVLLPFLGSGFVPVDTLPIGLRWFAEYQPLTPIIETVRGLLTGTAIGTSGILALGWCLAICLAGYLWAKRLFNRDPSR